MTTTVRDELLREAAARRKIRAMGYALHKDRARQWTLNHQGGYQIVNHQLSHSGVIDAGEKFDLTLDDVERWLDS